MEIRILSSLEKVFHDTAPEAYLQSLSLLTGEAGDFQVAFCCEKDAEVAVELDSALPVRLYGIRDIYARLAAPADHDDAILRNGESGMYPDALVPLPAASSATAGEWYAVWAEIPAATAGTYTVRITLRAENETASAALPVKILAAALPPQSLLCTHWFHSDCLSTHYKVPVFSEEYWRITENYVKTAVEHGINFLLTPLFTPPLDTDVGGERPTVQLVDVTKKGYTYTFGFDKLDRWIAMGERCGVKAYEMSHLFTQWGAMAAPKIMAQTSRGYRKIFGWATNAGGQSYKSFLTQFAAALIPHLRELGIAERCWFHTSDEPSLSNYFTYRRAARLMQSLFGDFRSFDALGEFRFYKNGLVRTPVPEEGSIEEFRGKVDELWTYFCCGQYRDRLPNRFFCMPLSRCRILGILFYLYDIKGFLQWGYNFWYTRYSKREVDPFTESDADNSFPSGDAYQVYPAPDGTAWASLRLKVFRDALEDLRVLTLLEAQTDRAFVEKLLHEGLAEPLTFHTYPLDGKWYEELRARINTAIENTTPCEA